MLVLTPVSRLAITATTEWLIRLFVFQESPSRGQMGSDPRLTPICPELAWEVEVDDLFHLPDVEQMLRVFVRLILAALLGGLLGAERQRAGKAAGLRTHMLVALGAAVFVLFPTEAGMGMADLSRVIQGVATGIGFIGAGTILKRTDPEEIQGLTTAANIWLTAAVGLAVGAGQLWLPIGLYAVRFGDSLSARSLRAKRFLIRGPVTSVRARAVRK